MDKTTPPLDYDLAYQQFVNPSKKYAHLIIPQGGFNQVAIDLIAAKILAINSDGDAPIFGVAHYGIVGDLNDVIPRMVKAIRGGVA